MFGQASVGFILFGPGLAASDAFSSVWRKRVITVLIRR
ncbi:hypothetical protein [Pseudomonas phage PfAC01b]